MSAGHEHVTFARTIMSTVQLSPRRQVEVVLERSWVRIRAPRSFRPVCPCPSKVDPQPGLSNLFPSFDQMESSPEGAANAPSKASLILQAAYHDAGRNLEPVGERERRVEVAHSE